MSYDVLGIDPSERVSIKVRNLTVSVNSQAIKATDEELNVGKPHTNILEDISFDLNSGELLAIMGGSGSGKTTLLNTLSQRLNVSNKKLAFSGSINYYMNDEAVGNNHIKNSYMLQTDFFTPGLSTWEFLTYQADLRLPELITKVEKVNLIESLLDILEIDHLRDKVIMTFSHKTNLSGGERRRVSLAVQLLNKPSLLFLDEPTTGLDTSSSLKLVQVLRKLSSSELGVTIVLSIHQPRPEISVVFDKICLLTRGGRLVYYGNLVNSFTYFSNLNLLPPDIQTSKIVDFIMDLSVKDTTSKVKEQETAMKINKLVDNWKIHQVTEPIEPISFESNLKLFQTPRSLKISFLRELTILTKRTFVLSYRDTYSYISLIGLTILLAIINGVLFYKPPPDLAGIRSYTSSLYVMLEVMGFMPLFIEIERLWEVDGIMFFREYTDNYVSIPGFILSRKLGKLILEDIPVSFSFAFITYFMWGLRTSDEIGGDFNIHYFLIYWSVCVLVYLIALASALAGFAVSSDFPVTAMIQNLFYQLQNSACGYFVNAATMPVYVRWLKYICYFWYAFGALVANQYTNWQGDCPYDSEERCIEYSGDYQLEVLGFPRNWISEPIWILVAWLVGFYLMAAAGFKFRNYDVHMAKTKQNKIGEEEESKEIVSHDDNLTKEKSIEVNDHEFDNELQNDVSIQLQDISLKVLPLKLSFKRSEFQILNSITANFQANKVNVIMGPSGSGKTTLLNLISNRLPKSSNFALTGKVRINDVQEITINELSKISGYVTQFDNSLIPHLTVRETFYYQAKLRLKVKEHPRIPSIINTLIREMGLVDCADTVVGNEILKGISGGERRRVSIGIQLLSKPKVLFLDEPTSGLDSATSQSIVNLLDQLTRENGTTIISTIHQPNETMFRKFGSMLLLARGGNVIYNGRSEDIENYLNDINFSKPENVNIADYILDIVSQGLDETKEQVNDRVNRLTENWKHQGQVEFTKGNEVNIRDFKLRKLPLNVRFKAIFHRQLLSSFRSRDALITRTTQVLALAVIHTLFFAPLRNSKEGIDNRLGLIQEVLNFAFIGLINNFSIFPVERDLFYQEYHDGLYSNLEFQAIYFIIESVIEILTCLLFSVLIVFAIGLPRTAGMYFSMFLTSFIAINTGESTGIMVNSVFDHMGLAINVLSNIMIVAIFMAGTMSLHMPAFFKAINYINPLKYAVGICAELSLRGQEFDCGNAIGCSLSTGNKVLEYYNLSSYLPGFFGGLIACFVIYRLVAISICEVKIRYFL